MISGYETLHSSSHIIGVHFLTGAKARQGKLSVPDTGHIMPKHLAALIS
jgi:hypothetical protein